MKTSTATRPVFGADAERIGSEHVMISDRDDAFPASRDISPWEVAVDWIASTHRELVRLARFLPLPAVAVDLAENTRSDTAPGKDSDTAAILTHGPVTPDSTWDDIEPGDALIVDETGEWWLWRDNEPQP